MQAGRCGGGQRDGWDVAKMCPPYGTWAERPSEDPQVPYDWEAAYRDERNTLIAGEQDCSRSYDKYVLTLSGGALGLSLTFVHDIIGDAPVRVPALIVLVWISFTLAVGAALGAIHQGGLLYCDFRTVLDSKAEHAGDEFLWTEVRTEQSKSRRSKLVTVLNYGSLMFFLLGVFLLLSFTALNLR